MVEHSKRKKHHDKDKYYRLAKEQGLRSRAAFKLTQINRKFSLLEKAKVVLDLCAAPGGWTQIASRTCGNQATILAVDILPIRPLPNVITLIGDITTSECHAKIRKELQGAAVDVVLSDGAPNVGADYTRDAYAQNEIALLSLKCATEHLKKGGSFVCKVYRSTDYTALLWVVNQLFQRVEAVKPASSRSTSAEIFFVCVNYLAPSSIDPRMLDPKTVFEHVEAGTDLRDQGKGVNIFHKKYGEQKRWRQGYDFTNMDSTFRNVKTVQEFIDSTDPVTLLSQCTALSFVDNQQQVKAEVKDNDEDEDSSDGEDEVAVEITSKMYLDHPKTTAEIKACISDLKVLNKNDFRGLLLWRNEMIEYKKQMMKGDVSDNESGEVESDEELDSEAEEEKIQAEIAELQKAKQRKKKRAKKKEREEMAKLRQRKAYGMEHQAMEVPDNDKIFTLATITDSGELDAVRDVNLANVDDHIFGEEEEDGLVISGKDGEIVTQVEQEEDMDSEDEYDPDTGYSFRLERELDNAYDRYLKGTKNSEAKVGTKMAKRSKKEMRQKAALQASEDAEMMQPMDRETEAYAKLLNSKVDSDDESVDDGDDSDDDGFHAVPVTPSEHAAKKQENEEIKKELEDKSSNPLIHKFTEKDEVVAARWFSNPLFSSLNNTATNASRNSFKRSVSEVADDYSSDEARSNEKNDVESDDDESSSPKQNGIDADEVLDMMPKTDKQIRHERRLKSQARQERKKARRERMAMEEGDEQKDFEIVESNSDSKFNELSEQQKQKALEVRSLIKSGMGGNNTEKEKINTGFEVVSRTLPLLDDRKYDSENEDYDSDDQARTLALGTMMLRRSKAKNLVDASYNRYSWNDPQDLPDWFYDDEARNYRPQLPIPSELVEKMKERFMSLANKPIKKVAEARARKSKRARQKLANAKKKAEAVANSSDMTETMKLRAISKAMRGKDKNIPEKKYVVSKKGVPSKGGKGMKVVDKRMKSDKRGIERAAKRKKGGIRRR